MNTIDTIVAARSTFKALDDLLAAQGHGYRPTIREAFGADADAVALAEAYDSAAEARGLPLRAYRPERQPLPEGVPQVPECVRQDRRASTHAYAVIDHASKGNVGAAAITAARAEANDRLPFECRDWFGKAVETLLVRLDADRPAKLTLCWIADRCRWLRDISREQAKGVDCAHLRSSGTEVRVSGPNNFYEYIGPWDGTLKSLREAAGQPGVDEVSLGGHWLCGESLDGDFGRTDAEWGLSLSAREILSK